MSLDHDKLQVAAQTLAELNIPRLIESTRSTDSDEKQTAQPDSVPLKSIRIRLKGIASMHDPDHTSILYIPPDDEDQALLPFCQAIQKIFQDKELLVKDDRPLKLHATIVNTIYAKEKKQRYNKSPNIKSISSQNVQAVNREPIAGSSQDVSTQQSRSLVDGSTGHGSNAKSLLKFDARAILDKYKDYTWTDDFMLDRIAICEMGAKKKFDAQGQLIDEEYTEVAHLSLPT
ncbi:hypothetical protein MRB53_039505 [Persea americana]|nr:hypothetical protein MRB53_039505 [Persea americana]